MRRSYAGSRPSRFGGFRGREFRAMSMELKASDLVDLSFPNLVQAGATPTLLTNIAIGTDFTARLGRVVMIKSIEIKGHFTNAGITYNQWQGQRIRCIVFVDAQPNGAACTSSQLLKNVSGANCESPINLDNRQRFTILCDQYVVMGPMNYGGGGGFGGFTTWPRFKFYKKLNLPMTFTGITGDIGSISTNAPYMLFLTDNAPNPISQLTFNGTVRCRFIDG